MPVPEHLQERIKIGGNFGALFSLYEASDRTKSYQSRLKKLSRSGFRFINHATFERFDTLGFESTPGVIYQPQFDSKGHPVFSQTSDPARFLLPRHLLMPRDGGPSLNEILYAGRHGVAKLSNEVRQTLVERCEARTNDPVINAMRKLKILLPERELAKF